MATIPTSASIPLAPAARRRAAATGSRPATPARRDRRPRGHGTADVAIVGAGFTGLWSAIRLLETDPSLRVTVLEADRVGAGASGRNGGFCAASLTHGLGNGLLHFPRRDRRARGGGPPQPRRAGRVRPRRGDRLRARADGGARRRDRAVAGRRTSRSGSSSSARHGTELEYLDRDAVQAEVHSPRFLAGVRAGGDSTVMLNPAKLAWGLAAAAERRGATIAEGSAVTALRRRAGGVRVETDGGATIDADHVLVATSAYSAWLRPPRAPVRAGLRLRPHDRAADRRRSRRRSAGPGARACRTRATSSTTSADRPTTGSCGAATTRSTTRATACTPAHDARPTTFEKLARQFVETFPQLADIRFTHAWGGAIDTTTRFTVTFGDALGGRVHYALGLHRARRRVQSLGGGHPARPAAPARLAAARPRARPVAAVPDPARAHPDARRWS